MLSRCGSANRPERCKIENQNHSAGVLYAVSALQYAIVPLLVRLLVECDSFVMSIAYRKGASKLSFLDVLRYYLILIEMFTLIIY